MWRGWSDRFGLTLCWSPRHLDFRLAAFPLPRRFYASSQECFSILSCALSFASLISPLFFHLPDCPGGNIVTLFFFFLLFPFFRTTPSALFFKTSSFCVRSFLPLPTKFSLYMLSTFPTLPRSSPFLPPEVTLH